MATFYKIETVTLSGTASSINFTNIPQTYTDLLIKASLRSTRSDVVAGMLLNVNGSSSGFATDKMVYGTGSSEGSTFSGSNYIAYINADTATASTFGNLDIYIRNYTTSDSYKSISVDALTENNATAAYSTLWSPAWNSSSPITSIGIQSANSANLMQYSSATLYGIKNS